MVTATSIKSELRENMLWRMSQLNSPYLTDDIYIQASESIQEIVTSTGRIEEFITEIGVIRANWNTLIAIDAVK